MQIIIVNNSSEKLMLTMVSRLRRLMRNALRTMKLPSVITSSEVAESVHDVDLRSVIRRNRRTEQPYHGRGQKRDDPDSRRNPQREETEELRRMGQAVDQYPSQARSD